MKIYLIRHGYAESLSGHADDSRRNLTEEGRLGIRRQAETLRERGVAIRQIFHSPFVRARQTAELVFQSFKVPLAELPDLVPGGNPESVLMSIAEMEENSLLVSHLPIIAELAFSLTGARVSFFPGTCIEVSLPEKARFSGELGWVLHPEP